ncbi:hypothetical protein QFC20_000809 [Naganishia adeliensis]|uniref:Uncharacterized protein n=1 Tax=Naganishia adeliensis TaxID=92952 RepID=A0ACC2WYA0_9TREE|nr:hypothetical protein QFC20_000809 [Naganishia adeliensis]
MSYFPGIVGGRPDEYAQTRPPQQSNCRYLSSGNIQQYREPGNGYVSPETISPYRSPAMQKDYSPSPSAPFPDAQFSPPSERPSLSQHQEIRQQNQSVPVRTNSIVDRMEGIEVSSNRGDPTSPREGMEHQRLPNRSGLVDGRGEGDVVMQSSIDGAANARRRYPDGRIGVLPPDSPRSYTAVKLVGDGSFGTVWLCDWASPLAPETKLSAMQCGAGARPEWVGKRLVAVKRMKRVWEGGWQQASQLGELVSLRDLASHPAIIPLYDAFLLPDSKELYFVFECMEGNMYQLTKSRKGRALAGGLVASIFHQVVGGLHHIHKSGYFHRDMKPENLLVTTTGLQDYAPVVDPENQVADQAMRRAGLTPPERPQPKIEKDVAVIVKLADFGLARSLDSAPPYTEYVSTRWYRAPEVLLRSKEYSAPVDLWALGTIMAELVNLKALFPGQSEVDQVWRICEILGDPSTEYGVDERGRTFGGGDWVRGIKMAKAVGFAFPKKKPVHFAGLFPPSTPISLVDCIQDLLRYNPKARLTAADCMNHPYFHLTQPLLRGVTQLPEIPFSKGQPSLAELGSLLRDIDRQRMQHTYGLGATDGVAVRSLPPSHSASPVHGKSAFGGEDGRTLPPPKISPDVRPYYQTSDRASVYGSNYSLQAGQMPEATSAPSASSSQTMLNLPYPRTNRGGASALVDQLRELDLPTDALSTFGRRPIPSEVASQERPMGDTGLPRVVPPPLQSSGYANTGIPLDRTLSPYAAPAGSSSSLSFRSNPSDTQLPVIPSYQRSHLPPHMASPTTLLSGQQPLSPYDSAGHYGSQRSFESGSAPGLASLPEDVDMMDTSAEPVRHPDPRIAQSSHDLPISSKKKKWGLSSVFGGSHDKAASQAPSANIVPLTTSASLKRTQSGAKATDRFQSQVVLPPPQIDVSTITDPKKAKEEAKRQAKELERAKREAMERAQKERARAVMQKRTQLEQARKMAGSKSELEWNHVHGSSDKRSEATVSSKTSHTSGTSVPRLNPDSPRASSLYQQQGGASYSTFSVHSGGSPNLQKLSEHNLRQAQGSSVPELFQDHDTYRAKARRRGDHDDHSTSNLSLPAHINASRLTIDSDPGPGGTRRVYPFDQRAVSNFSLGYRFQTGSNASIDRQLARDFQTHANLDVLPGTTPGSSSTGGFLPSASSMSGPTTPYGHSMGHAVSGGLGLGRPLGAVPYIFRESDPAIPDSHMMYHSI